MYYYGPRHMAEQKQDVQLEHTFSSYVKIRDVALKTCQRRWTIGRSGERGSGISVLAAWHDDDDDGLPKETVTGIMMLYSNTKVNVRSSDGDIDFSTLLLEVLQVDTLELYLFIICQDYVVRLLIDSIKSGFTLKKAKSSWYPTETITDADYADYWKFIYPSRIPTA